MAYERLQDLFPQSPSTFLSLISHHLPNSPTWLLEAGMLALLLLLYVKCMPTKLFPISGHLCLQFPLPRKNFTQIIASLIHLLQSGLCSDAPTTEKCHLVTLSHPLLTTPTAYTPSPLLAMLLLVFFNLHAPYFTKM